MERTFAVVDDIARRRLDAALCNILKWRRRM